MREDYHAARLDELLERLLDERLSDEDGRELNSILQASRQARNHYRASLRLHAALIRHPQLPAVAPPRRHAAISRRWLAAAACLLLASLLFQLLPQRPVARITGTSAAVWSDGSEPDQLVGRSLELASGYAEVSFHNGVRVILEGPCRFKVTSATTMDVTHGRATAKVPHSVGGFHLDTPAGRITDIGTEFGIAVGSGEDGPVILAQVFDGEIEVPAEKTPRKRLLSGDALAILGGDGGTRLVSTMGDYQVDLADSARHLPRQAGNSPAAGNLALGKPVSSPSYYAMPHGSVFPPSTLTDGRLNDSGSPGDWSFWLAPNGEDGEFTVDLLESMQIGRIDLQNTRNRTHGDRGMRHISVQVSNDGEEFHELFQTELQPIIELPPPGEEFPFQSFTFPPVNARHVRVVGLDHHRNPKRPPDNPNHGGGLNEIRIFAP